MKKLNMNYLFTITFMLCLAVSIPSYAQVADTLDLGEVVITASKTPTTERETTKPVTVIGRQEIERNVGSSISELLNQQNGVQINGSLSNTGKDKSVYLRGASTQYTLILVDGFPVTDPSGEGGAFDLRLLPLENVERIEIVKGSMSTLYGSDAIAGVINIITKKPEEGVFNLTGKASYGSFNTNNLSLGANGQAATLGYSINLSRDFTQGISEAEPTGNTDFNKDGYTRRAINSQISVEPVKGLTITPFLNYSVYNGDYDDGAFSDGNNQYEANLLNTGARFTYEMDGLEIREATTITKTERKFTDSFGIFDPKASLVNSDLYAVYDKPNHFRFLAGLNVQYLNFELYNIDEGSSIISPYVTAFVTSGFGLNGEFGVRLNKHSEYGSNWTFNVSPVYNLNEQFKLLASLSSGYKAPTLNELFGPFGANTDLKPQRSLTLDAGVEFMSASSGLSASVLYFRRSIDDLISYNGNQGYININEQNDSGVEVSVKQQWSATGVELYYNYLDGAISQNGQNTDNLIRRPDHNFGLNLYQKMVENLSVNLSGQYVGKRNDIYFNSTTFSNEEVELDPYLMLGATAQYKLHDEQLVLFLSGNNILNSGYTEVYGFNTPGFHFKTGVKFSF